MSRPWKHLLHAWLSRKDCPCLYCRFGLLDGQKRFAPVLPMAYWENIEQESVGEGMIDAEDVRRIQAALRPDEAFVARARAAYPDRPSMLVVTRDAVYEVVTRPGAHTAEWSAAALRPVGILPRRLPVTELSWVLAWIRKGERPDIPESVRATLAGYGISWAAPAPVLSEADERILAASGILRS